MSNTLFLLTGGTGLLGSNILRQLVDRRERVRVLVLPNDHARASIPDSVEVTDGGLLDGEALDRFFEAPADTDLVVIHAAGIVTLDPNPNELVRAVNVDGTRNIVERCVEHRVRKLVYVSSTSVIPELPEPEVIREVDHLDPEGLVGYYAQTKAMATELVMQAAREQGLDASIVYPSGIFGPNDSGRGLVTSSVRMMARGVLRISVGGTFNSVDARDLAAGIIACAERGRPGEGYIMASRCYTVTQLLEAICSAAGLRPPFCTIPLWLTRPFVGIGTLYSAVSHTPAWFSHYTIYNLERNNNYSAEKAERELGFRCRPLEDSMADTIAWLREEGELAPAKVA